MGTLIKKGQIQSLNMIQSLTVISGKLWITQAHDSEDYILSAGDCFFAMPDSHVIIEALEDSALHLSEPSELKPRKSAATESQDSLKKRHVS